jgi:phosphoserine phosphatase RsbU/P
MNTGLKPSGLVQLAPPPVTAVTHGCDGTPATAAADRIAAGRLEVLLVEDNPGDARLLRMALADSAEPFFHVTHVSSLGAAIAHLQTARMDVVLLDLTLPDSAGAPTIRRLQDAAPTLPIVVMTGLDDPAFANHALEMGAQDYLVKGDDTGPLVGRAIRYAITRMAAQIERQSLIDSLEAKRAAMKRELDAARTMQFSLLPRSSDIDPRLSQMGLRIESCFNPSSDIGGDLWGCVDYGPEMIGIYCFDFSGHGISAALNVFRLHTLIREHCGRGADPGASLRILNQGLKNLLQRGQYATIFFGIIDVVADELIWAGAGHPPPILFHPDGTMEHLDTYGVPIGLVATTRYANHATPFPKGSSLLLYSDAVTEAKHCDDSFLGEDGLQTLLDTHRDGNGVNFGGVIDQFFGSVALPLEDDLTALYVTRV